jgi:hypothetical protein
LNLTWGPRNAYKGPPEPAWSNPAQFNPIGEMKRIQIEIDATGNVWEGDYIIKDVRKRALEIKETLPFMHVLTTGLAKTPWHRILIFTEKDPRK